MGSSFHLPREVTLALPPEYLYTGEVMDAETAVSKVLHNQCSDSNASLVILSPRGTFLVIFFSIVPWLSPLTLVEKQHSFDKPYPLGVSAYHQRSPV